MENTQKTSLLEFLARPNVAVCYFIIGMMLIPLNDAFIKFMSTSLSIFEIMGLRSVFSTAMALLIPGAIASLLRLNLKTIFAIFFTAPLIISLLSIPLLGEKLGIYRGFAVITGMIGVLIIVQPGTANFQIAYLMPILSAFSYAFFQLITRYIRGEAELVAMVCVQNIIYLLVGVFGMLFIFIINPTIPEGEIWSFLLRGWQTPTWSQLGLLFIGACILLNLALASSNVYSNVEATYVAPFEYIALPMAVLWGVVIWGDWPNIQTWIGITLILSGGIIMVYRENQLKKTVSSSVPMRASAANAAADPELALEGKPKEYPENPFCF